MTIKQVEVKRLFGLPEYQNVTFGYVSDVGIGENPDEVRQELWDKIQDDYLNYTKWMRDLENKAYEDRLARERTHKEDVLTDKARKILDAIDRMEQFLRKHGVEYKEFNRDELPF